MFPTPVSHLGINRSTNQPALLLVDEKTELLRVGPGMGVWYLISYVWHIDPGMGVWYLVSNMQIYPSMGVW